MNITLIEVPYWWDYRKETLIASIHQVRPEVVKNFPVTADPIPKEPPATRKRVKGNLGNLVLC